MKLLAILLLLGLLLVVCWPLAVVLLVFFPILWLISIPFRIVGIAVHAALAFIEALLFLPIRILRHL